MYELRTASHPGEVVTYGDLDSHLRLSAVQEDVERAARIAEAVASAIEAEGVPPLRTRYELTADPLRLVMGLRLPRVPVRELVSAVHVGRDGAETAVEATLVGDVVEPVGTVLYYGHVVVTFEAGPGESVGAAGPDDVHPAVREAILRRTATLFDNRSDAELGTVVARLDPLTRSLLGPLLPVSV